MSENRRNRRKRRALTSSFKKLMIMGSKGCSFKFLEKPSVNQIKLLSEFVEKYYTKDYKIIESVEMDSNIRVYLVKYVYDKWIHYNNESELVEHFRCFIGFNLKLEKVFYLNYYGFYLHDFTNNHEFSDDVYEKVCYEFFESVKSNEIFTNTRLINNPLVFF